MTRHQTAFFGQVLVAFDVLVSAAAFVVALMLRSALTDLALPSWTGFAELLPVALGDYGLLLLGLLPLWLLTFRGFKTGAFRDRPARSIARHVRAVGVGIVLLIAVQFLLKLAFVSRSFVVLFAIVQLVALVGARALVLGTLRHNHHVQDHRVLIVGCGSLAIDFAAALRERSPWHNRLLGHVMVPGEVALASAEPRVGRVETMDEILDREPVDEVVFAVADRDHPAVQAAIAACDVRGIEVLLTMPSALPVGSTVEVASVTGFDLPMIGLSRKPRAEGQLVLKRVLDVLGALLLIVLTTPLMLGAAIAIAITSRGPILVRQVRAGLGGRRFTLLKFRPVGRLMRAARIDELPQLFNVIAGDMSLVGPRPPLPTEVAQYEPWQRRRLSVRPGIVGPRPVSGRNSADDLDYIDNWSLWLDVRILLRTVPVVRSRAGAG